jgi:predicted transcriptional regulator of viral defense system
VARQYEAEERARRAGSVTLEAFNGEEESGAIPYTAQAIEHGDPPVYARRVAHQDDLDRAVNDLAERRKLAYPRKSSYTCRMQDRSTPDMRGLEAEAYQQGGYFTADQAHAHRASRQLVDHYVRRGRFERVRRGLYRIQGFPIAQHDEMRRAWMAVGRRDTLLSHESALALLGLSDVIPDSVHLLVPRRRHGLRKPSGVMLHTHPDSETVPSLWRDGLPLTAAPRTIVDVADRIQPEQLAMAVRQALRRGLLTADQLQQETARRASKRQLLVLRQTEAYE